MIREIIEKTGTEVQLEEISKLKSGQDIIDLNLNTKIGDEILDKNSKPMTGTVLVSIEKTEMIFFTTYALIAIDGKKKTEDTIYITADMARKAL